MRFFLIFLYKISKATTATRIVVKEIVIVVRPGQSQKKQKQNVGVGRKIGVVV